MSTRKPLRHMGRKAIGAVITGVDNIEDGSGAQAFKAGNIGRTQTHF